MKKHLILLGLTMSLASTTLFAQNVHIVPISAPVEIEALPILDLECPITRAEFIYTLANASGTDLGMIMDTHYAMPAMLWAESLGLINLEDYPEATWSEEMTMNEKNIILSKVAESDALSLTAAYTALSNVLVKDIQLDGNALDLGTLTLSHSNGQLMVPLRAVAEAMGFELTWDAATYTATLTKDELTTSVQMGFDFYETSETSEGFSLGAAPKLINGTMYVSADYFSLFADQAVVDSTLYFVSR